MNKKSIITLLIVVCAIVAINIIAQFYFFRIDLTSEKRYSISKNTKDLLKKMDAELAVNIYLDGNLNSDFLRLKKSTAEMLDEFKAYGGRKVNYTFINPSEALNDQQRVENYQALESQGLYPYFSQESDAEGQPMQRILFPWAQVINGKDTVNVSLFKEDQNRDINENLNISIENLEFELTDAIRMLTKKRVEKVAFIEGHNELPPILTYDITVALSKYFQVDRGVLGNDPAILDPYKAIIIAKPQERFTESEKFIVDQYIMNGGRVLWLVDGVRVSMDTLATYGMSPALVNDLNLNDQLFRYGVRINPNLIMDAQCAYVRVNVAPEGSKPQYRALPWYYAPLLLPSPDHPITRGIPLVKSEFVSSIDFVGNNPNVNKEILLITSQHSKAIPAPTRISLEAMGMSSDPDFFNQQYFPVAVSLSGTFPSVFTNRQAPQGVILHEEPRTESYPTRMVVASSGDLVRNEVTGYGNSAMPVPLGYDEYMRQEFGNRSFILNSILYLTDDEGWLTLRSRQFTIRLLDKIGVNSNKKMLQAANVAAPVLLLIIFAVLNGIIRKRKYSR